MESKDAMFDIANNKSPGIDGFPFEFFKAQWETLGLAITQAVNSFLIFGHILKEWNRKLLILIPKTNPPKEAAHLHPISLCNTVDKCASKCMLNRLKPLLPHIIDNYQNAFLPGRHMDDNILISHELTHNIIKKQHFVIRHLVALKLDMNKAYDRVS